MYHALGTTTRDGNIHTVCKIYYIIIGARSLVAIARQEMYIYVPPIRSIHTRYHSPYHHIASITWYTFSVITKWKI